MRGNLFFKEEIFNFVLLGKIPRASPLELCKTCGESGIDIFTFHLLKRYFKSFIRLEKLISVWKDERSRRKNKIY